ncbi:photosynthetic reaction center subunit H [Zavarzinia sp. CC-PAN008]|uniref:photosynthetic reaction center subunit H n=1 Tax=Zavarzinia sp. CC-PAN008 TaxID=3243332 RepID=UPI003F743307
MVAAPYGVDWALVSLYVFLLFFAGLILYLRREDRREGYPLEEDGTGRVRGRAGLLFAALPKTFHLPHGGGVVQAPNAIRDTRPLALRRVSVTPGSPSVPTGNPLVDGVGPAAYAQRRKVPDMTNHGEFRIVPLREAPGFYLEKRDPDPRGMKVYGADGKVAGTVADVWVDRGEVLLRYLEVALADGSGSVLTPITVARIEGRHNRVRVDAIAAAQFVDVPRIASPGSITFDEEERVAAYYGGGYLYGRPGRTEPLL